MGNFKTRLGTFRTRFLKRVFAAQTQLIDIYDQEPEVRFRASNLLYVISGASAVISALLLIFMFASPDLIQRQAKLTFVPLFAFIGLLFVYCQKLVLQKKLQLARSLVLGMAIAAVLGAITFTGGFPTSIASVAIFIPVIISYSLFGGRVSHITAAALTAIMVMQWVGAWRFGLEFPDFSSRTMPEANSAIALGATFIIVCSALVVFDVSNRKYIQKADAAMISKTNFLANTSHEIRTPMNGIIGLAEVMLLTTKLDQDQKIYMDAIQQSGKALMTIINDILDYSRLESGHLELAIEPFNFYALTQEIRTLMTINAADKNVVIACRYPENMPQRFVGDAGRIRQVLINLMANAIKFTEDGHVNIHIDITPNQTDATILVQIEDTGIGIPGDKIDRIFERFTQADSGTTQKYGGTGLGLSISQKLVHMMNGRIGVVSEVDKGSTFWFELALPLAAETSNANLMSHNPYEQIGLAIEAAPSIIHPFPPTQENQILIISQDPDIISKYGDYLRRHSVRVFHTHDLAEAQQWMNGRGLRGDIQSEVLIDMGLSPDVAKDFKPLIKAHSAHLKIQTIGSKENDNLANLELDHIHMPDDLLGHFIGQAAATH